MLALALPLVRLVMVMRLEILLVEAAAIMLAVGSVVLVIISLVAIVPLVVFPLAIAPLIIIFARAPRCSSSPRWSRSRSSSRLQ